jgi:hypothetical protein
MHAWEAKKTRTILKVLTKMLSTLGSIDTTVLAAYHKNTTNLRNTSSLPTFSFIIITVQHPTRIELGLSHTVTLIIKILFVFGNHQGSVKLGAYIKVTNISTTSQASISNGSSCSRPTMCSFLPLLSHTKLVIGVTCFL